MPTAAQDARTAADALAGRIGVSSDVLFAQFAYETGDFSNVHGGYNFGNLMPAGTFAQFADVGSFVDYFAAQLERNWPNAIGAGDDATAYVAGLYQGRLGNYSASATQSQYAAGVRSKMGKDERSKIWGIFPRPGDVLDDVLNGFGNKVVYGTEHPDPGTPLPGVVVNPLIFILGAVIFVAAIWVPITKTQVAGLKQGLQGK